MTAAGMNEGGTNLALAVRALIDATDTPFRLDQAVKWLRKAYGRRLSFNPTELAGVFRESRLTFYDGEFDRYVPRKVFFKGARFRVVPQPGEVEAGLLFPGHRLMPFYSREIFPAELVVLAADGRPVEKVKAKWRVADVVPFHSLLGVQNMLDYFVADDEGNTSELAGSKRAADTSLALTALDLSRLYQEWNFEAGDSLLFTVEDWSRGRYRVEPQIELKARVDRAALETQWRRALEDALEEVFDESGVLIDTHEQLSLAFFYGGPFLIETPALSIATFLAKSSLVQLCQVGFQALLWRSGEPPTSTVLPDLDLRRRPSTGASESLETMLVDLGTMLRRSDIEAYMRDEVWRGGESLGSALERCLRWCGELNFHDDRQRFAFSREIESLWMAVLSSARGRKDKVASHRSRALRLLDEKLKWLKQLEAKGVRADELPSAEFLGLSHLTRALSSLLEGLNAPDAVDPSEEIDLTKTLDEIEESERALIDAIEARIELRRIAATLK